MILAILNALVAIPKIAGYVEQAVGQIVLWYVQRANNQTLSAIADASALASRAKSDEERYAAAQKWQEALSRPRVSL